MGRSDPKSPSDSNKNDRAPGRFTIPAGLKAFSETSCLLPGESRTDFEAIRQLMIDDIRPETNLEWLWLLDFAELSWEILRYRRLKQRVLDAFREGAIETILLRLDSAGIRAEALSEVRLRVRRNVADWRHDPRAAVEIETRLQQHDFGVEAINAKVYCQAQDTFALFKGLMHSAQNRRMALLREINYR
jgi:hypothetical protein